jgi:hypothetical protein
MGAIVAEPAMALDAIGGYSSGVEANQPSDPTGVPDVSCGS